MPSRLQTRNIFLGNLLQTTIFWREDTQMLKRGRNALEVVTEGCSDTPQFVNTMENSDPQVFSVQSTIEHKGSFWKPKCRSCRSCCLCTWSGQFDSAVWHTAGNLRRRKRIFGREAKLLSISEMSWKFEMKHQYLSSRTWSNRSQSNTWKHKQNPLSIFVSSFWTLWWLHHLVTGRQQEDNWMEE